MKKIIPIWIKDLVKNIINKCKRKSEPYICPICNNKVTHFDRLEDFYFQEMDKYQYVHSIFDAETLNLLHYSCPKCGSSDRNRMYALYFEKYFAEESQKNSAKISLLDIAPDANLSGWIKKFPNIQYRSMDLYMDGVDDKVDITDMNIYLEGQFDFIICSHVLEHIVEDVKAISEIFRVLKPGGKAIMMVPILLSLSEDFENSEYTSEADRWKYFGQGDHVRMYSKSGFVTKLSSVGFKVTQLGVNDFGTTVFEKHGIQERAILYLVEK